MSWLPDSLADFEPAALAALMVGAYLVLGEPFVGWVLHRRFESAVGVAPGARRWLYGRLLLLEWGLVAIVLAVSLVAARVGWAELGVRWPDRVGIVSVVVVVVILAVTVISVRALRTGVLREAGSDSAALRSVGSLLPRTDSERRLFAAVAVTAGIGEEVVYRGFGIAVLAALAPALPWWGLVAAAGAAFGLAHAYQGPAGILTTGLLGSVLAAVYLDTGSVLLPVMLHALIDLRFLAVPPDVLPGGSTQSAPASSAAADVPARPDDRGDPGPHDTQPIDFGKRP
ncbi:MAG: CPBP family intramembrane metalloprotease [Geodermatophilaceae bacterium]|nr:CPBP family intramembrane metalloprotease [Geodermatophilaceae bacterium]MDQ3476442.1 CPBP family intramembrane metalloprotease [Actinomycetota bacterium]